MTTFKRWYLLLGLGVVLAAAGPRGLQALWMLAAFGFLTLVALSIKASRRRSYRKFVLEPRERVDHLVPNHYADHTKDIL